MSNRFLARAAVLLSCALAVGGCAVSKQMIGPNGEIIHSINCSGTALTMGDCLAKAGQICGSAGYEIIGGDQLNHGYFAAPTNIGPIVAPMIQRELIIRCKVAGASKPLAPTDNANSVNH